MSNTVLITGASTGIGKAAAEKFLAQGWNVVATMRDPSASTLAAHERLLVAPLDVTDHNSIEAALVTAKGKFGTLDAVVNNAGYGLTGTFESMSDEQVRRQFETNVFGLMAVSKQVIPLLRETRGALINVASMGGRTTFPFFSVYHATKWAVDGFSESLAYELAPQGIRVRIIEPGAIKTDFYGRSNEFVHDRKLGDYNDLVDRGFKTMNAAGEKGASPKRVADAIFKAAADRGDKLRYLVGADAKGLLAIRRVLPFGVYRGMIRKAIFG